ncbi:hypothetical protein MVEN_00512600 [Mycena venus]|uniref:Uncharacterized protein n=1 Tax=Mycena venus TaxID=2733690 RepID=A0A8H7D7H9_9AGAR|nr:hypothetical protein MVEN_00512600 [Mycena venus]
MAHLPQCYAHKMSTAKPSHLHRALLRFRKYAIGTTNIVHSIRFTSMSTRRPMKLQPFFWQTAVQGIYHISQFVIQSVRVLKTSEARPLNWALFYSRFIHLLAFDPRYHAGRISCLSDHPTCVPCGIETSYPNQWCSNDPPISIQEQSASAPCSNCIILHSSGE